MVNPEIPCSHCLCVPVCREKDIEKLIEDCPLISDLLFSYKSRRSHFRLKTDDYEYYIMKIERVLRPRRWGYSRLFKTVISMISDHDFPCQDCICIPICRHKHYKTMIRECNLIRNLLYFPDGQVRKDQKISTHLDKIQKILRPTMWVYSHEFGVVSRSYYEVMCCLKKVRESRGTN